MNPDTQSTTTDPTEHSRTEESRTRTRSKDETRSTETERGLLRRRRRTSVEDVGDPTPAQPVGPAPEATDVRAEPSSEDAPRRRRRGGRGRSRRGKRAEEATNAPETVQRDDAVEEEAVAQAKPDGADLTVADPGDAEVSDADSGGVDPGDATLTAAARDAADESVDDDDDGDETAGSEADAEQDGDEATATEGRSTGRRRRRRGGRGRRGRGRGRSAAEPAPASPGKSEPGDARDRATDTETSPSKPTRLSSRSRRDGRGRGRRPGSGVSEETRRAIAESPPRRMLVSVGAQRTQLAVLEERNLVEHYVTRNADVSYVGNIYLGRVQNVLPGMEAAFIDIGKGRNGVLYAGEVNYDEADLDGDLPRIEQTLQKGQTVLVQVTKDPMGTKGARLTQQLSIAGRYCVLAPGDAMLGISRKLPDAERDRLRDILKDIKPEEYGLIVRTAAEGATPEQLSDDVARLVRLWEQISERASSAEPLEAIYEEPELVIRVIRDVFGPDFTDIIVDDPDLDERVRAYLREVSPHLEAKVSRHIGDDPLYDAYEVTNQIRRALEKKVWLASGGYLIIEKTEAMWIIDVNTGKFVGESNLEETVLKNNIEAAVEIAHQLRLRDMGGIIVIDFVDMLVPANRDEVLKRFRRELARDKTKSRVMEISKLGLVQMTRKNVSQGINDSFTTVCDCCEGRGAVIAKSILG